MKKQYEVVWEIFNKCSGDQMRDVYFEEIETDDPNAYVENKFQGYNVSLFESPNLGELIYEIDANGLRQRMTLTEI